MLGLLRSHVAMLRAMLRYVSRKLLILKQCYMLRFFGNECDGQIGNARQKVQNVLQYILGKPDTLFLKKHNFITLPTFSHLTC